MQPASMMPDLVVERLSAQQVRLAFPLMRLAMPALTLAGWLRFARRTATGNPSASKGILAVRRRGSPHLCGVVCYRRDHDLQSGSVLTAEHFVALDLLHPRAVLAALASALEGVAACLGCRAVRSVLHAASPKMAEDLKVAGHVLQGIVLERGLPYAITERWPVRPKPLILPASTEMADGDPPQAPGR